MRNFTPGELLDACPECGLTRIVKKNSKTGELFIACCGYPKCRKTWPIDDYHEPGDYDWKRE